MAVASQPTTAVRPDARELWQGANVERPFTRCIGWQVVGHSRRLMVVRCGTVVRSISDIRNPASTNGWSHRLRMSLLDPFLPFRLTHSLRPLSSVEQPTVRGNQSPFAPRSPSFVASPSYARFPAPQTSPPHDPSRRGRASAIIAVHIVAATSLSYGRPRRGDGVGHESCECAVPTFAGRKMVEAAFRDVDACNRIRLHR